MRRLLVYLPLGAFAATMLIPFVWTVATSLKPQEAVFSHPPRLVARRTSHTVVVEGRPLRVRPLDRDGAARTVRVKVLGSGPAARRVLTVPADDLRERSEPVLRLENYPEAWRAYPFVSFWRAYANSLAVAALVTLGQVVTSSLAAYAFARLRFPGRDLLFLGYLGTMMIPGAVTLIPTFILLKNLPGVLDALGGGGWFSRGFVLGGGVVGLDSYFALIVPRVFSAYGTFMLRQFFLSIPRELEDAARMDGCGSLGILLRVILPLSRPALATLSIFTFLWAWGDFMWPLLVTHSHEIYTLPLLLSSYQGQYGTHWPYLMAASVTALAPLVAIFVLGQRYFIEGIQLGAVKG
ncbi:MAG: ABC transporter permease subunit [Planctomycetes bacterium]|nr:ABC transporter permease subunit [Planctomycetota bacterium]